MGFFSLLLFLLGFFAFFNKRKYITLIVIAVLSTGYFRFVDPNFSLGPLSLQHSDMALLLIFSLLPFRKSNSDPQLKKIKKLLLIFLVFLTISIAFDLIARGTEPMQILRTVRKTSYLFFFFLIESFSSKDYKKFLKYIIVITVIHSVLYISQYIFAYSLTLDSFRENELGNARYRNSPSFLLPILAVLLFIGKKPKYYNFQLAVLFITVIMTQSRGAMIAAGSIILLYLFLQKKMRTSIFIITIVALLFGYQILSYTYPIIGERFSHLQMELSLVDKMDYNNLADFYHEGSLIFRWGVTYERLMYVLNDPVFFFIGVGYVPDMDITQPIFIVGTISPKLPTGFEQYNSVDIFFPNIITRYGILGSIIFLYFIIKLIVLGFKNRNIIFGKMLLTYLIALVITSFNNESFYNCQTFFFIFIVLGLVVFEKQSITNNTAKVP